MVLSSQQRRFRFSIRSLMICVALCALVMTPILWTIQNQRLLMLEQLRAVEAEQRARAEADRAHHAMNMLARAGTAKTVAGLAPRPATEKTSGLWAALSANHSVFTSNETKDLVIEFAVVNDGDQPIDPGITGSRLMINGTEIGDSALVVGNGPRDIRFTSLPPGDHVQFTSKLGDHFKGPGTYRVSWRSEAFLAPEITIRVLPPRVP